MRTTRRSLFKGLLAGTMLAIAPFTRAVPPLLPKAQSVTVHVGPWTEMPDGEMDSCTSVHLKIFSGEILECFEVENRAFRSMRKA